ADGKRRPARSKSDHSARVAFELRGSSQSLPQTSVSKTVHTRQKGLAMVSSSRFVLSPATFRADESDESHTERTAPAPAHTDFGFAGGTDRAVHIVRSTRGPKGPRRAGRVTCS